MIEDDLERGPDSRGVWVATASVTVQLVARPHVEWGRVFEVNLGGIDVGDSVSTTGLAELSSGVVKCAVVGLGMGCVDLPVAWARSVSSQPSAWVSFLVGETDVLAFEGDHVDGRGRLNDFVILGE